MIKMPYFRPFSESSILVEWPPEISSKVLSDVLGYKKILENHYFKQKVDVINAYNSLLIKYNFTIDNFNSEISRLKSLFLETKERPVTKGNRWVLPACYDERFGWDLEVMSSGKKMTMEALIASHSEPDYLVYFIGFLPGFLYLGGLPPELHTPRLITPRERVVKGAVGIGGQQTGIYPTESPGGWNIIGNCPVDLFEAHKNPPCFVKPGDTIKFDPISFKEHADISLQIKNGVFDEQNLLTDV